MQYLHNQWSDFKNFWSCLILTLYPLHCTLIIQPHYRVKQLLWKLQFFTGEFFGNGDFIGKDEWPPNTPDLNPLNYHVWGAMLERYKTFQPKPNTTDELKKVLANNMGWSATELHQQGHTELCHKTSSLCESWGRTLWTRLQINLFSQGFELLASCDILKCQISMFSCFHLISIQALQYKHYDENLHGSVVV